MAGQYRKIHESDLDINIAGELSKYLQGVLQGMTGVERGKLLYFSMRTVMSRQSKIVRNQVLATRLNVPAKSLKDAVWSWANGWAGAAGVKVRPSKGIKRKKGKVPIERIPGWKLPILLWAIEGTKPRTTKKGAYRGRMRKENYTFLQNKSVLEARAMEALPKEVNRRVVKWLNENLNK